MYIFAAAEGGPWFMNDAVTTSLPRSTEASTKLLAGFSIAPMLTFFQPVPSKRQTWPPLTLSVPP
jgi:hypothetical protein